MNLRPSGYEPDELPGCSTPRCGVVCVLREGGDLIRSGGDLLSRVLGRSTISGGALNGRVRDGIGCIAPPMATRPDQGPFVQHQAFQVRHSLPGSCMLPVRGRGVLPVTGSDQAYRTISTGQLSALLRVHLRPIDVVVCHGPASRDLVLREVSRLDAFSGYPVRT